MIFILCSIVKKKIKIIYYGVHSINLSSLLNTHLFIMESILLI